MKYYRMFDERPTPGTAVVLHEAASARAAREARSRVGVVVADDRLHGSNRVSVCWGDDGFTRGYNWRGSNYNFLVIPEDKEEEWE